MARSSNPLNFLVGVFDKLEGQVQKSNDLLDEAVDVLYSIDKKLDKQGGKGKITVAKGAGKEVAVALEGITALVKEINQADAQAVDKVINSIVSGVRKIEEVAKDFNKDIKEFNKNILMLGVSILGFAASMVLATPLLVVGIPAMLITGLAIYGLSKLFEKIDTKSLSEGAGAMKDIAIGMAALGLGFLVFKLVDYSDILKGTTAIVLVGGAMALLGKISSGGKGIEKTAKALMFAGIAIGSIGLGMFVFQKMNISIETVLVSTLATAGIGLAMGLAGKFAGSILKGALAMTLAAIPLMLIGFSLEMFAKSIGKVQQTSGMGPWEFFGFVSATVAGIGVEMGLAGLAFPFIAAGSAAMILAGGALMAISAGLQSFADVNFTVEESEKLTYALTSIKAAFMGTDGKAEGGFFSKLGGMVTGAMDSVMMIEAAAGYAAAGGALTLLSKGLGKFQELNFTEDDSMKLSYVLSTVTSAFAQAGGEPANPGGIFGAVFGNAFSPNAVERGIDSVMDAGEALTNIAMGLKSFQALIENDVDFDVLGNAISLTLGFVSKAFASIGGMEEPDSTELLGFKFSWDENLVAKGIDAVKGAGKELTQIAQGLQSFQDLVEQNVDWDKLSYAVKQSLTFVGDAFKTIGGAEESDSWLIFSWDENIIAKGIEAVQGAGEELTNIANGLLTFQELIDKDVDFSKGGKLSQAVKNSLTFVGDAFATIGGKEESDGWFIFSWDENLVQKGIENVQGAGEELKNIAMGLKSFSEIAEPEKILSTINAMFGGITNFFTTAANKEIDQSMIYMGMFANGITDIAKASKKANKTADAFQKIAKATGEMKDNVNAFDLERLTILDNLFYNLQQLSKIDGGISELSDQLRDTISDSFDKLAEYMSELNETTANSGNSITNTLQNLNPFRQETNTQGEQVIKMDPAFAQQIASLRTALASGIPVEVTNINDLS